MPVAMAVEPREVPTPSPQELPQDQPVGPQPEAPSELPADPLPDGVPVPPPETPAEPPPPGFSAPRFLVIRKG